MSAQAATKPLKAYAVSDDEHGTIVFDDNSASARRRGGDELGCEWEGVQSCRRAPWADQFAEQGWIPAKAYLEAGWWRTCHHCGNMVGEDTCGPGDIPHEPVFEGEDLYCNQGCKDAEVAEKAAAAARKQELIDATLAKWPEAEITHASDHDSRREVRFRFPGGTQQASWRFGDETVSIAKVDEPAWLAYREMYRARSDATPE